MEINSQLTIDFFGDTTLEESLASEFDNYISCTIPSYSNNQYIARSLVSSFISSLDPCIDQISNIRTAVGEAFVNCAIHAYHKDGAGIVRITCGLFRNDKSVVIIVSDNGVGIPDIERAREPLFTTISGHRGVGFTYMEMFMKSVFVQSTPGKGTSVIMCTDVQYDYESPDLEMFENMLSALLAKKV